MVERRLYHSVADQIEELIASGVFPPGSRLPGERDLAERFGVSRVTVREAEISLQALGRIEVKTGSGVYVCEQRPSGLNGTLGNVSAFELTEARALYEGEGAALAAPIIDSDTLAELDDLLKAMSSESLTQDERDEADRQFHLTIARATGNSAIVYVVEALWKMRNDFPHVKKVYASVCRDADDRGDEHRDILNALKARDPKAARGAMRRHFTRLLEAMLQTTEEEEVQEVRRRASESRERFLISAKIG